MGKWIEFICGAQVYHDKIQMKCDFDCSIQIFGGFMGPVCANGGILITVVIILVFIFLEER